jgi:hypothetical protein
VEDEFGRIETVVDADLSDAGGEGERRDAQNKSVTSARPGTVRRFIDTLLRRG